MAEQGMTSKVMRILLTSKATYLNFGVKRILCKMDIDETFFSATI